MNRKYKAVIFDFDYTLVDSSKGVCECSAYALEQMGFEIPSDDVICKSIGMSLGEMFTVFTSVDNIEDVERFKGFFKIKADDVMNQKTRIFDDVFTVVKFLNKNEIKCGIVSTKFRFRIMDVLEREGLAPGFDIVIGGEDISAFKPDPEGLLKAIDILGIKKEECLYVGDSIVDAKTAQNAQVDFIAVLSGMTSKEQFRDYPYIGIMNCLGEIVQFI